mmetsp:Transcript_39214/g.84985  ORF Transcript_39214/g.84985 Transcript_39214/m.84985 type:complete len:181 (+) Transcript_39214:1-543(+)
MTYTPSTQAKYTVALTCDGSTVGTSQCTFVASQPTAPVSLTVNANMPTTTTGKTTMSNNLANGVASAMNVPSDSVVDRQLTVGSVVFSFRLLSADASKSATAIQEEFKEVAASGVLSAKVAQNGVEVTGAALDNAPLPYVKATPAPSPAPISAGPGVRNTHDVCLLGFSVVFALSAVLYL